MLLATDELHRQLDLVAVLGWDSQPGRELLEAVRSSIVRPVVRRARLIGSDASQAEATGWATAWEVLRRPSLRAAENPAGMVWVAVRRAVHAEVRALRTDQIDRYGGRAWDDVVESRPVEFVGGVAWGDAPGAPAASTDDSMGGLLALVIDRLVDAGWDRALVSEVVAGLAETATAPGGHVRGGDLCWRRVAKTWGVAPWQVRRLAALLVGGSGVRGLLWLLVREGLEVLDDPAARAAVRATARRWSATPEEHLRVLMPASCCCVVGLSPAGSDETCICVRTGAKRTVPPDRAAVGAPNARAAGPTSAVHGGLEGRHHALACSPAPDSPEYP